MTRVDDWPRQLVDYVEACRLRPFAWGSHDCLQFGAGAVLALTGRDLLGGRYVYHDAEQAAALLRDEGFESLEAAVTHHVGAPLKHYRQAGRGDLALVELGGLQVLGVVLGVLVACPGPDGLVFPPLSQAVACWKI
ncbi:hypothetical protein FHP25_35855 [Vineibacter terrae]|uniref:DUF6950 domain-containing protein n=1 Tax=Vineibacter terrae TaxID=2586908 RepID=A0A5C8P999_9HYPH|nr:hypothetical protein [Vineibacter terrae]TXL70099.1 hypothetical protein FHP25_35855 [Vineibacter terrae]